MADRRAELRQAYKQMKTEAGVYRIKNTVNQKTLVVATPNIRTMDGKRFELRMGSHMNAKLQAEWKEFGEDAFVFEVLEVLDDDIEDQYARQKALKEMERKWLDELRAHGEQGYRSERAGHVER